jgi:thiamine biosynthesis lipoprotein
MGTEARLVLFARDRTHADSAAAAAFARIARIDRALSDYRIDSEVATVAAAAGDSAVVVSQDFVHVLSAALDLARATGGAFDPTAGPLTSLLREARRAHRPAADSAVARALALVNWRCVRLNPAERTVRLDRPGMRLDFGGIAKGFAADEALAALRAHEAPRSLVVFGGEIVAGEPPPGRPGWTVTLDDGTERLLARRALSTSGDAEQFLEIGGVRYSHVIDARDGRPLTSRITATVLAPDGMTADALATAVTVLDSAARVPFIAERPWAEFLVRNAGR